MYEICLFLAVKQEHQKHAIKGITFFIDCFRSYLRACEYWILLATFINSNIKQYLYCLMSQCEEGILMGNKWLNVPFVCELNIHAG